MVGVPSHEVGLKPVGQNKSGNNSNGSTSVPDVKTLPVYLPLEAVPEKGDLGKRALDFSKPDVTALKFLQENFVSLDQNQDQHLDKEELVFAGQKADASVSKGIFHLLEPQIFDNVEYIDTAGDTSPKHFSFSEGFERAFRIGLDAKLGQELVTYDAKGVNRADLAAVNSQFNQKENPSFLDVGLAPFQGEFSGEERLSSCGLVAAMSFANAHGKTFSYDYVKKLASMNDLWDVDTGMHGSEAEQTLLELMGISVTMDQVSEPESQKVEWIDKIINGREQTTLDEARIRSSVENGKPVMLSTVGHYFVLQKYDAQTGKFYVGNSARMVDKPVWMKLDDLNNTRAGRVRHVLYLNDESPKPPKNIGTTGHIVET